MSGTSIKVSIPHPLDRSISLVGVLEQPEPGEPTQNRELALILHGTIGHKDYLFQKKLAGKLPIDSFRFDFRGNHESGGEWNYGGLTDDLEDIQTVADYLSTTYGYTIKLVIGHSRGSMVSFRWLSTTQDGRNVPAFVNISGRYRMTRVMESPLVVSWQKDFAKQGYSTWNTTVARRQFSATVTPEDVQKFSEWDTSFVWEKFPKETDVLTIHGLSDELVPPYDGLIYAGALGNRSPGTHSLHLMEDADHIYTNRHEDLINTILDWWDVRQKGELVTGVWIPGVKSRL